MAQSPPMMRAGSWFVLGLLIAGCSAEDSVSPEEAGGTSAAGQAGNAGTTGGTSSGGVSGGNAGGGSAGGGNQGGTSAGGASAGQGGVSAGAGGGPGGNAGEAGTQAGGTNTGGAVAGGSAGEAGAGGASGEAGQAGAGGAGAEGGTAGTAGSGGAGGYTEPPDAPGTWRSVLYPKGWAPLHDGGKADEQGRFLHDFSHAGYHRGEVKPAYGKGTPVSEVDAAAGDGKADATGAIQKAIDEACAKGGGVVRLPAGLFRVKLPTANSFAAITIGCSKLVLRGDGPSKSRILLDDPTRMRNKAGIAVRPASGSIWDNNTTTTHALAADAPAGTRVLEVGDTSGLAIGDWVALRNEVTADFRAQHRMDQAQNGDSADWWPSSSFQGLVYPRRITKIENNTVELDAPTRYELRAQDKSRLYKLPASYLEEVGIESLGIGAVQNTTGPTGGTEASHDDDYQTSGTTGYEVHASRFVDVGALHDGWIYEVHSFVPDENKDSGVHMLSHGIQFSQSAFRITVSQCDLGRAQYRGGGGNGYLFHVQGNDLLFEEDHATNARHGFILNQASSGNVFLRSTVTTSRLTDDAHRFLAQANLYDGMRLEQGWLSAVNRGNTSSGAGFTSTAHVFWNTQVIKNHASAKGCAIETAQWSWGYAIGTSAESGQSAKICTKSVTNSYWASLDQGDPVDFTEGEGQGATLSPPSLYDAQRARRCAVEGITCDP